MKKQVANEEESYEFLIENIKDDNQRKRIELALKYYIQNANSCKKYDRLYSIILVILPALATLFSCALMRFPNTHGVLDITVPVITAATSIAAGISSALKFKDKKIAYRDYAENLKNILTAYSCNKGEFSGLDLEAKEELLFDRTEQIIREGYKKLGNIEKGSGDGMDVEK